MLRSLICASLCLLSTLAFAGKFNEKLNIGDSTPKWDDLPGVDGKTHSLDDLKDHPVIVVAYTCNSCPYAVDYEDRLIALAKKYANTKVAVVAINVNLIEEDNLEAMAKKSKAKGFPFPYLFDESQEIAKQFGATRTPEFFVLNQVREVVYMGAFDDNTDASKVTKNYVEEAVQATLSGKEITETETAPIGCAIRILSERQKLRLKLKKKR